VGEALGRRWGRHARESVVFANYLHKAGDIEPREDTCRSRRIKVLTVGEFHPRKGHAVLVQAAKTLVERGLDIELHLVGSGDLEGRLRTDIKASGLGGRAIFHGYIPHGPALFDVYRSCDVFVLPSVAGEGAPKVVVEAMCRGLPVVATDVGATAFIAKNGERGLIVPPRSHAAMAEALERVMTDSVLRRRLIAGGLEYARENTNGKNRAIVRDTLQRHVGELTGRPLYLDGYAKTNGPGESPAQAG
jgi:glycosyltransferase involved in cell wall biosynthesis